MIKKLTILKMTRLAFKQSFEGSKLSDKKVRYVAKLFQDWPKQAAIIGLTEYLRLIKHEINNHQLKIESPTPLSARLQKQVQQALNARHDISTTQFEISPQLLAGLRLTIGDYLYDSSLQNKIKQIGEVLHG